MVSDQVTLSSTYCFYSPTNGWRHSIRAIHVSGPISSFRYCLASCLTILSKLSAYGIQGQLHTWLTDFLYSCSQCVALTGIISSHLPVEAEEPQGSVLSPVLFLIFINDLSLENPLYVFSDASTLCHDIPHPSDRQAAASSFSSDLDTITSWFILEIGKMLFSGSTENRHTCCGLCRMIFGFLRSDLPSRRRI